MTELTSVLARPGVDIRYSDSPGIQPAVVFLHGAGADHVSFDAQAAAVRASGRRVVLVDLRAHGQSRPNTSRLTAETFVDDIDAIVTELRLLRPVLAGHSLGGNIGQALVRRHSERFAGLIVMGSTWNTGPLTVVERLLLKLAAPALALIPAKNLNRIMADASAVTSFAKADAVRAFSQLSKREFIDVWRATVELVAPEEGYRTPVPLLLIRGAEDRTGNIATAMAAWAGAEGVVEHVIPGAGHLVTQDAPDETADVILTFLQVS